MNWIEVNGTSLRYDLSGSGPTTLVLVHEMGGTLDSWDAG
jgi:3-oxoadipate enol-lactonase